MRIFVIGNCQARTAARLFRGMRHCSTATAVELSNRNISALLEGAYDDELLASDIIFCQEFDQIDSLWLRLPAAASKVRTFPTISFRGFHPDADYVVDAKGGVVQGSMGDYQSAIAFTSWSRGDSLEQACSRFERLDEAAFKLLHAASISELHSSLLKAGLNSSGLINRWMSAGCWLYSMNHPSLHVLADICAALLGEDLESRSVAWSGVDDELARGPSWPLYPSIAAELGLGSGSFDFLPALSASGIRPKPLSLKQFVSASYELFERNRSNGLKLLLTDGTEDLFALAPVHPHEDVGRVMTSSNSERQVSFRNPYRGLPSQCFWKESVSGKERDQLELAPDGVGLVLQGSERIATAGSCFAQHLSARMASLGLNYYVEEGVESPILPFETEASTGVFSCRYGNVYTAKQLLQLFFAAFGSFEPGDRFWRRSDGRYIDPLRPIVEPAGFSTRAQVWEARLSHLNAVRSMFLKLDVFVFTLGLTEAWVNRFDGAVYPLAPGVVGGEFDPKHHSAVNFAVSDIVSDMALFIEGLHAVNSKAKVLLTVSPVPLAATFESRHVLVSTVASKSILRAVAEELVLGFDFVHYFPSYEYICNPFVGQTPFEADGRSIKRSAVDSVMGRFVSAVMDKRVQSRKQLRSVEAKLRSVICDEEFIDISRVADSTD